MQGYTRTDGTVVKTHIRELSTTEKSFRDQQAAREVAGNVIDFVPIIGDAKAFKESAEAFMGSNLEGTILGVAGTVGLVPFVGDLLSKPIKAVARFVKKEVGTVGKSVHDEAIEKVIRGGELFAKGPLRAHTPTRIPSSNIKLVVKKETTSMKGVREDLYKKESVLAKTLRSPSPSGHDIIMAKIRAGGPLKFDRSTPLIHKPTRIPKP